MAIHFLAYSFARAQSVNLESAVVSATTVPVDECKDRLPTLQEELRSLEIKYADLRQNQSRLQEEYLGKFNEMTQVLMTMAKAREEETRKISQSRDQLKISLQKFNEIRTDETSKSLQENYLDLTLKLYTSFKDSQKSLEELKSQLNQIESSRSGYLNAIAELESFDHQKLAIEAKMVNLKIKCPSQRYF